VLGAFRCLATVNDEEKRGRFVKLRRLLVAGAAVALVAGALALAGCSSGSSNNGATTKAFSGAALVGAGATFPGPVYSAWAQSFQKVESGAQVNYQAIGSGGGVQQFTAKTVDFGATDVSLLASETAQVKGSFIQFPTCLGAVTLAYNVPGLSAPLNLDGPTLASIFLGKIKKWNDPAIAALNSGVKLPSTSIQIVHRADGSGTTSIFTTWLSGQSADWKSKVGKGKSVQWPVGQGGNGNAGVAAAIKQTAGAIGYIELQYAATAGLPVASVKAPDGTFVVPSVDSVAKAASGLSFPITETTNILDSSVAGAYPISSTTYILIYTDQTDQAKAQTLVDFWTWALTKGQSELKTLNYAPLPSSVAQSSLGELGKITVAGKAVTPSPAVK
jgi:phosphate transport system substrate-binding protein